MNIIFALPDYSSGVIEVETPKIILCLSVTVLICFEKKAALGFLITNCYHIAEPRSQAQTGAGKLIFHVPVITNQHDWQPYPVCRYISDDHTYCTVVLFGYVS